MDGNRMQQSEYITSSTSTSPASSCVNTPQLSMVNLNKEDSYSYSVEQCNAAVDFGDNDSGSECDEYDICSPTSNSTSNDNTNTTTSYSRFKKILNDKDSLSIQRELNQLKSRLDNARMRLGKLVSPMNQLLSKFFDTHNPPIKQLKSDFSNEYFNPSLSQYTKKQGIDMTNPLVKSNHDTYVKNYEMEVQSLTILYNENDQIFKSFHLFTYYCFHLQIELKPLSLNNNNNKNKTKGKEQTTSNLSETLFPYSITSGVKASDHFLHHFKHIYSEIFMLIARQKYRALDFIYENKKYNQAKPIDQPKSRRTLSEDQKQIINGIFKSGKDHPYPNDDQKIIIACKIDLSKYQTHNWFGNKRNRVKSEKIKMIQRNSQNNNNNNSDDESYDYDDNSDDENYDN